MCFRHPPPVALSSGCTDSTRKRRAARAAAASVACLCFPLGTLLAFGLVQAGLFGIAESNILGVGLLRSMPGFSGIEFIADPGVEPTRSGTRFYTFNGSVGGRMLADMWSLLRLDPDVVGATRREALWMVISGYTAAAAISAASIPIGLLIGEGLCRLAFRPSYWAVSAIKSVRSTMLIRAILPTALWAYPVTALLAAINVLFFDTYGKGPTYGMPTLGWSFALLCAPVVSGIVCAMREYGRAVRSRIGAREFLCDCDYECGPGVVCPECGKKTRELPATLRWRWRLGRSKDTV